MRRGLARARGRRVVAVGVFCRRGLDRGGDDEPPASADDDRPPPLAR
jgi:hypothetical protein